MVEVSLALIAALGSVATAYVAVLARKTHEAVNGQRRELLIRIAALEELLTWTRGQPIEPSSTVGTPRPGEPPINQPEP